MKKRLYGLDILRVFAAYSILTFHSLSWEQIKFNNDFANRYFSNGAILMVMFYIISGFCLHYSHREDSFENNAIIDEFYIKRIAKIYPGYVINLIMVFILSGEGGIIQTLIILPIEMSMLQMSIPQYRWLAVNAGLWFFTAILISYFIFPYLVNFDKKRHMRSRLEVISILYLICATGTYSLSIMKVEDLSQAYFSPIIRVLEFIIGFILYDVYFFIKSKIVTEKYVVEMWTILIIVIYSIVQDILFRKGVLFWDSEFYAIPFFCIIILMIALLAEDSWIEKIGRSKQVQFLSSISFTIYLSQPMVFYLYNALAKCFRWKIQGVGKLLVIFVICTIMSCPYKKVIDSLNMLILKHWKKIDRSIH